MKLSTMLSASRARPEITRLATSRASRTRPLRSRAVYGRRAEHIPDRIKALLRQDSAITQSLATHDRAALHGRAGPVLDQQLAAPLVAVGLVADFSVGGDARQLLGGRTDGRRLEDAGLLGP